MIEEDKYCLEKCEVGKEQKRKALEECDSVYDAVFDVKKFIEECKKKCIKTDFSLEEKKNV